MNARNERWERRWSSTSNSDGTTTETGRIVNEDGAVVCHLVMSEEVDANARLLAAAPDLADFAAKLIKKHDARASDTRETRGFRCGCALCEEATALLRKAGRIS